MNLNLTFLTNVPAPYRLPVWEYVGRAANLEVLLLNDAGQSAGLQNRGPEWATAVARGYTMREVPTWCLTRGEATFYTTKPFGFRLDRATSAIVIWGWESPSYMQALLAAKRRGIPAIGYYESTLLSQGHSGGPVAAVRRSFFRHLDAVVVPGEAAEECVRAMNLPALRIFRGFNAVDVRTIHEQTLAARRSAIPSGSTAHSGHRYLYLGQLIPRKNVGAILSAFGDVAQPDDTLTIAGTGHLEPDLRATDVVGAQFIGAVPYGDIPHLLADHDTLVVASTNEVWGLVVNEALAAGLHVVVSDRCGVAPSVRGMSGVTVVAPTVDGIRAGLVESRRRWRGPIESPEILEYGPEQFAQTFLDAARYAISLRSAAAVSKGA